MTAVYMALSEITLREPTVTERRGECDGCRAPSVYAVLTTGSTDVYSGKRSGHFHDFRMCRECCRLLRNEVVQQITYNEHGEAQWRA